MNSALANEVITVSELNHQARRLLEGGFPLRWVAGEISNLTRASSGHLYFSLKDSTAQVRCAMFRSRAQALPWKIENGQQVEAQALVTLYEARGEFQLNVEGLRRAGVGRLYELFLRLREKLSAAGLFDSVRKRPLPPYPRKIGIVTSTRAAALRDVIATLSRRAPHVALTIYPTLVQGADAPATIVAALQAAYARADEDSTDLLLLVRGGGSIEDLWAFNDEMVARTLAVSPRPTIAGIGHETDTTIADHVADLRAPTPTAAAELASAGWFEAATRIDTIAVSLRRAMEREIAIRSQSLDRLALRLVHPARRLAEARQRLELLAQRLLIAGERRITRERDRLRRCEGALTSLSPLATLSRGYSIVRNADGYVVRDACALTSGDTLDIQFASGHTSVTVARTSLQ